MSTSNGGARGTDVPESPLAHDIVSGDEQTLERVLDRLCKEFGLNRREHTTLRLVVGALHTKFNALSERIEELSPTMPAARQAEPAVPYRGDPAIDHPKHYTIGGIEVIDVIEAWKLGFHLGNVVKYIARSEHKGEPIQDPKKARWYLDRFIAKRERELA